MSVPRYPGYKESGVDWLGELPKHWSVGPLKRGFSVTLGKMLQPDAASQDDELLPYLRAANIQWDGVDVADVKTMWFTPRDRSQLQLKSGDLLVSEGGDVGRSTIWKEELPVCYFQNSVNRVRPIDENSTRFLYYWMSTIKDKGYVDVLCNKSTIAHFTAEKVAAVPVPFPSKDEQVSIADFLDHETTKIDALVAEQEKLMALLKEKRQAVISHAVTKGLDPTVPMKDSGVEWLGKVPAHWEVGAIKRFFKVLDGRRIPLSSEERSYKRGDFPYYGASGVIDSIDEFIFDEDLVLVSEDGANLINRATPISFVARGRYWVNNHAHILRPIDGHLVFWSERIEVIDLLPFVTGSAQPKLTIDALANLMIAVPFESREREQIESFIISQSEQMDVLIREASAAICLLHERRAALISAAVTGKIDVRGTVKALAA